MSNIELIILKGDYFMAKYKCKICGYIFDEDDIEEGLNIPAGTKFDDLPSSFKCPKCRMAKGMFEKVE